MNEEMITYYRVSLKYDDPVTPVQRVALSILQEMTGISIDISTLTYGSAAETILKLHKST